MYFTTSPASLAPDQLCKNPFRSVYVFFVPCVVKSEKRNTEFAEVHRGAQRNPSRTARSEWPSRESFSIELPPWRARSLLAGFGRLRTLRVESALFIAADPLELRQGFRGRSAFRHFQFASQLKPLHDGLQIRALRILRENLSDGAAD